MERGIHIETGPDKERAQAASTAIVHVLRAGFEAHVDSGTMQVALQTLGGLIGSGNYNISNCNFDGKTVNT